MQMKSLAIVAATVMTVGAAQAADLNKPAKVAVDYVKVCDAYGAGFFYIPGSDTCLKISGFARLDVFTGGQSNRNMFGGTGLNTGGPGGRSSSALGDNARADVQLDARTNTQYGLLRSFIDFHTNVGTNNGGLNRTQTMVELDHAFVQWGGLTAGRTTSKYNFGDGEQNNQEYYTEAFTDNSVNLLAYTFAFGNGVTGTISLEDPTTGGYQGTLSGTANASTRRYSTTGTFQYGALNLPDFVGNINVTQAWGEAQLSAVAHQVYGGALSPATKEGYAFQAGILFNVPQLGAGDTLAFNGAYGSGAVGFVESYSPSANDVGQDAVYNFTPGAGLKLSRSWEIGASFVHNFSPMIALDLAPGYFNWQNSGMNMSETLFSAALDIKPVKGLLIKPDFEYRYSSLNNAAKINSASVNGSGYVFGVRIQRSF